MLLKLNTLACQAWLKNAAYCATVILLVGCAAGNSYNTSLEQNDILAAQRVQERARLIPSLEVAQKIEAEAEAQQAAADARLNTVSTNCIHSFLVNHCINQARARRNDDWDAAQVNRTAARLYIRQTEAETRRTTLQAKVADYNQQEIADAPKRAANKAAFEAKRKAYDAKLAATPKLTPEVRAANVSTFEEKRNKIIELQKKREENKKKLDAKAAQQAAKAAAAQ